MPPLSSDSALLSADYMEERLDNGRFQIEVSYYSTLCDTDKIRKEIAHPFLLSESPNAFEQALTSALTCIRMEADENPFAALIDGFAIIRREGGPAYKLKASKHASASASSEVRTETTLQGPQTAFCEDVDTNLMIVRRRYPQQDLMSERMDLGRTSQTKAYLVYDKSKAHPRIVEELRSRLNGIEADVVFAAGQIEALITKRKYSWFPLTIITERPDRCVLNLSQGKIALLIEGTPFTLIAPAVFQDFMSAMDDLYLPNIVTHALVFLRYVAILITTTLPALYVAVASYNPEMIRVQFALSLAGSRAAVPYPSFFEVLLMLFLIEGYSIRAGTSSSASSRKNWATRFWNC